MGNQAFWEFQKNGTKKVKEKNFSKRNGKRNVSLISPLSSTNIWVLFTNNSIQIGLVVFHQIFQNFLIMVVRWVFGLVQLHWCHECHVCRAHFWMISALSTPSRSRRSLVSWFRFLKCLFELCAVHSFSYIYIYNNSQISILGFTSHQQFHIILFQYFFHIMVLISLPQYGFGS